MTWPHISKTTDLVAVIFFYFQNTMNKNKCFEIENSNLTRGTDILIDLSPKCWKSINSILLSDIKYNSVCDKYSASIFHRMIYLKYCSFKVTISSGNLVKCHPWQPPQALALIFTFVSQVIMNTITHLKINYYRFILDYTFFWDAIEVLEGGWCWWREEISFNRPASFHRHAVQRQIGKAL